MPINTRFDVVGGSYGGMAMSDGAENYETYWQSERAAGGGIMRPMRGINETLAREL